MGGLEGLPAVASRALRRLGGGSGGKLVLALAKYRQEAFEDDRLALLERRLEPAPGEALVCHVLTLEHDVAVSRRERLSDVDRHPRSWGPGVQQVGAVAMAGRHRFAARQRPGALAYPHAREQLDAGRRAAFDRQGEPDSRSMGIVQAEQSQRRQPDAAAVGIVDDQLAPEGERGQVEHLPLRDHRPLPGRERPAGDLDPGGRPVGNHRHVLDPRLPAVVEAGEVGARSGRGVRLVDRAADSHVAVRLSEQGLERPLALGVVSLRADDPAGAARLLDDRRGRRRRGIVDWLRQVRLAVEDADELLRAAARVDDAVRHTVRLFPDRHQRRALGQPCDHPVVAALERPRSARTRRRRSGSPPAGSRASAPAAASGRRSSRTCR